MMNDLYFDEGIQFCDDHGEYTDEDQRRVGIEIGCPVCFAIDEEADRAESAC